MDMTSEIDREISSAEAALKQAEEIYGKNHEKVSYCLDNLVRILRRRGIRALDAANMDARARAIRTKCNEQPSTARHHRGEITEAITIVSKRRRAEKRRRVILISVCVAAIGLVVWKLVLAPSQGERALVQESLKNVNSVLPTTHIQNVVVKGKAAVDSAQSANDMHNKQLESFMDQ